LTNFPKTESALNTEMQLGQHLKIPAKSDLLIDRGDGLLATMPNFDGNYYRLDAHHSPHLNKFVERQDFQSLIIATAPQYIYFNTQNGPLANLNLQSSILIPMGYTKELDLVLDTGQKLGDELWIRRIDAP